MTRKRRASTSKNHKKTKNVCVGGEGPRWEKCQKNGWEMGWRNGKMREKREGSEGKSAIYKERVGSDETEPIRRVSRVSHMFLHFFFISDLRPFSFFFFANWTLFGRFSLWSGPSFWSWWFLALAFRISYQFVITKQKREKWSGNVLDPMILYLWTVRRSKSNNSITKPRGGQKRKPVSECEKSAVLAVEVIN